MEEYGLSEQGAGYAFGILIAAFGVGCVLGGFLQDRHGPRCAGLWGTALLCGGFFAGKKDTCSQKVQPFEQKILFFSCKIDNMD